MPNRTVLLVKVYSLWKTFITSGAVFIYLFCMTNAIVWMIKTMIILDTTRGPGARSLKWEAAIAIKL